MASINKLTKQPKATPRWIKNTSFIAIFALQSCLIENSNPISTNTDGQGNIVYLYPKFEVVETGNHLKVLKQIGEEIVVEYGKDAQGNDIIKMYCSSDGDHIFVSGNLVGFSIEDLKSED